jgi:hypothetical protein
VRLIDAAGHGVDLRVTGYQFPDAESLAQRYSWHMVEGTATCPEGSWMFRYPALTCDETPYVAAWLRAVAGGERSAATPGALTFTEPNLALAVAGYRSGLVALEIRLDLEFSPPWQPRRTAGEPFVVRCQLTPQQLERAATEWEQEIAPYPDGPSTVRPVYPQ